MERSDIMRRVKSKDTRPEILVRSFLFSRGYRFRLHQKQLPGKPDIVLKKYKTVVLINGCFWHGHENCVDNRRPITNKSYWKQKVIRNKKRDEHNIQLLKANGWSVVTIWTCQLKNEIAIRDTLAKLELALKQLD